jgi:hypothetical protein
MELLKHKSTDTERQEAEHPTAGLLAGGATCGSQRSCPASRFVSADNDVRRKPARHQPAARWAQLTRVQKI